MSGYHIAAITGKNIYSGDLIKVNEKSSCFIRFIDDKTHVQIGPNSIVKINENNLSKDIKIIKGNIYIKNLYVKDKKTYIFTENNQIYLSNHRIWIDTDYSTGDKIFTLDSPIDIFNINTNKKILLKRRHLVNINKEEITYLDNFKNIVPQYILSDVHDFDYSRSKIELKKYDLIPVYGQRIRKKENIDPYNISLDFGTEFLNSASHIKVGLYPQYKYKNLLVSMRLESYVNPSGNNIDADWNDFYDILDKIMIDYTYNDDSKDMTLHFGEINNISFGNGYLMNNLNNILDYPRKRESGLLLKYNFDVDFMDLKVVIPSIRDFKNSGGVIGLRTSLFISHKFPLTIGLGLVTDLNQFSHISNYLNKKTSKRAVHGVEFDFNFNLKSTIDFEMDIFGEFVGLWYPEYNYYILFDGNDVSNDLKWRKGTWGINAPGISLKFNNRYLFKFSFNYNSATFIPNYFNSTYLYNRARYYKADLDYPLVQKQINSLNDNFLVDCDSDDEDAECEYLIPQDVYPILFFNNGFSAYDNYGFSTEFIYNFHNYINVSLKTSVFLDNSSEADLYYSFQTAFNINNGYIRNLYHMKIYYSNIFFSKLSDNYRVNFGIETEVKLPMRLSLIINLGQVYYDSNIIIDNNIDKMTNSAISLKYNF